MMSSKGKKSSRGKKGRKGTCPVRPKKGETSQTVTLDQALDLAVKIHRSGVRTGSREALRESRILYERILEAVPEHPVALHFFGVLLHQTGQTELGVEKIGRALELRPDYVDAWNNLGNLRKVQGRLGDAREAYERAIGLQPNHADAHSNLGAVQAALGELESAVRAYDEALLCDPDHVSAHHNLANALHRLGRREEAIGHYRAAIALDPTHPDARKLLGQALYYDGRVSDAIEVVENWLKLEPENPEAQHLLAAWTGESVPLRASDGYVQRAFDALAESFDDHLRGLGYQAPGLVQGAIEARIPTPRGDLAVLDAGCGTGLCSGFLKPHAKSLVGVDLSEGMLARARALGVYDEIVQQELTQYLCEHPEAFDMVVSVDTLCYFGDLRLVLEGARQSLRKGGTLFFTVEKSETSGAGFLLNPHGRYSHTADYVTEELDRAGFAETSVENVVLRQERSKPVHGLLVVAS
jgi:predicted TPR repeat methyltransferase